MKKQTLAIVTATLAAAALSAAMFFQADAQPAPDFSRAKQIFSDNCSACHGEGGLGGDRAPVLIGNVNLRKLDVAGISAVITGGTSKGMPPFGQSLTADQIKTLATWLHAVNPAERAGLAGAQQVAAGEAFFFGEGKCSGCHMVRGQGGSNGPDLTSVGLNMKTDEIARLLDDPTAMMGSKRTTACPGWGFCPNLEWTMASVKLRDGSTLRGFLRNEGEHSLIVQTLDGQMHFLDEGQYVSYVRDTQSHMPRLVATAAQRADLMAYIGTLRGPVMGPLKRAPDFTAEQMNAVMHPKPGNWTSYNGSPNGNRYSTLDQINTANAAKLKAAWVFAPGGNGLEATPVVIDGMMYVTGQAQVCALDARTGLSVWCVPRIAARPTVAGEDAPGRGQPNRGVAVLGDRVYFETDDGYMVCLNRFTGGVVWQVAMKEPQTAGKVYATMAPLIVDDLVIGGVSGVGLGGRGFIVAYKASTGELVWRFYAIPRPGEPNAETWKGTAIANNGTGGAGAWMTGSYDPDTKLVYWGTSNPNPSNNGDERQGRNLYANSILAMDPKTGKLKWFFQPTPHDLHDWDSTAPLVLVDALWQGKPRKLLMQGNRNGFFFVLDRVTGEFLLGKPFVKKLTWASGIDATGTPILLPDYVPPEGGHLKCPAVRGATNWYSTSYNPGTKLFYLMAAEDCTFYRKVGVQYAPNPDFKDPGRRILRALDPQTGAIVWEKPLTGSNEANYTGVLSTAGGVLFFGETAGGFAAIDAKSGKSLWHFLTNDSWRASPMTYTVEGKQYVAVTAGTNVIAFTLGD